MDIQTSTKQRTARKPTKPELYEMICTLEKAFADLTTERDAERDAADEAEKRADTAETRLSDMEDSLDEAIAFIEPIANNYPGLDCSVDEHMRYSEARTVLAEIEI